MFKKLITDFLVRLGLWDKEEIVETILPFDPLPGNVLTEDELMRQEQYEYERENHLLPDYGG